jgi:lipopolysaccharide transport system permease protein
MQAKETIPSFTIRSTKGLVSLNLREMWEYRDLLSILIWRDIRVRYKQTAIGIAWVVIQPLFAMAIFTLFFGKLAKIPSGDVPYPIFAYAALLPWQFFSKALTEASTSLVVNERVITKVYFPRLLVPTAVVLAGLIDFAIAFTILIGMMIFYGIVPSWGIVVAPLFLFLALITALGVSFWLSALDVEYRDVRYTLPFLTQLWLFASPVVYPSTLVPEAWRSLYGLNPMVGVVEGFRWALLGSSSLPDLRMLLVSIGAVVVLFISGLFYFRHMERTMADRI